MMTRLYFHAIRASAQPSQSRPEKCMRLHAVGYTATQPNQHVAAMESARAAQIVARKLSERFPDASFTYCDDNQDFPDSHPRYRLFALSRQVQCLVAAELALEEEINPRCLPKWIAFRDASGGGIAYPEDDTGHVTQCRRDPEHVEERSFYGTRPTPAELLDLFRAEDAA